MQRLQPDAGSAFLARDRAISVKVWANPLDILWEIKRLLELVRVLFLDVVGIETEPLSQGEGLSLPVVNSSVGVDTLAKCHENIILAFTQAGDDDSRMAMVCAKASRVR